MVSSHSVRSSCARVSFLVLAFMLASAVQLRAAPILSWEFQGTVTNVLGNLYPVTVGESAKYWFSADLGTASSLCSGSSALYRGFKGGGGTIGPDSMTMGNDGAIEVLAPNGNCGFPAGVIGRMFGIFKPDGAGSIPIEWQIFSPQFNQNGTTLEEVMNYGVILATRVEVFSRFQPGSSFVISGTIKPQVPEPATLMLVGLALGALAIRRKFA